MNRLWKGLMYDKDGAAGGGKKGESNGNGKDQGGEKPSVKADVLDWDTWHGALPKNAQTLIADHESGLKTALGSEREARGDAEKALREVAGKLEKGSVAQKEVLKLADEVSVGTAKTEFYEDAHEAGIINLKLAYHIAVTDELFDKRGNINFEKMKENYPELFTKAPRKPPGGAGDGAGGDLDQPADMNVFIRKSAGRK